MQLRYVLIGALAVAPSAAFADWDGFYAGAAMSSVTETLTEFNDGVAGDVNPFGFSGAGGFAGFNVTNGNIVFGGELAYTPGPSESDVYDGVTLDYYDVKGRVGVANGDALIYGIVGYSTATHDEGASAPVPVSGMSFGAGVDFMVTDRFFVGFEFLNRMLAGDYDENVWPTWSMEIDSQAVSLRAGMKFR